MNCFFNICSSVFSHWSAGWFKFYFYKAVFQSNYIFDTICQGHTSHASCSGTPEGQGPLGVGGLSWLPRVLVALSLLQGPRELGGSFSAALIWQTVTRIFHGHFPAPMAVPLGGALNVDLIRQWTIPVAPTSHKKLSCDLSLTHLLCHEKRNV